MTTTSQSPTSAKVSPSEQSAQQLKVSSGFADLSARLKADLSTPEIGDTIVFDAFVKNSGPATAQQAKLEFPLPDGYLFLGSLPSHGNYDPAKGLWDIGELVATSEVHLRVNAVVVPKGPFDVRCHVHASNIYDPDSKNNWHELFVRPKHAADLSIALLEIDTPKPEVGQIVTISATVVNSGPGNASGAVATIALPAGYVLVGSDQKSYDPKSGSWKVGPLAVGEERRLGLHAQIQPTGPYGLTARVTGRDRDPDQANNTRTLAVEPKEAWEDKAALSRPQRDQVKQERALHEYLRGALGERKAASRGAPAIPKVKGVREYKPGHPLKKF
jgi:uncharacterized repeat protein (TIGR01451 family)